jgi:hypothetical protein
VKERQAGRLLVEERDGGSKPGVEGGGGDGGLRRLRRVGRRRAHLLRRQGQSAPSSRFFETRAVRSPRRELAAWIAKPLPGSFFGGNLFDFVVPPLFAA